MAFSVYPDVNRVLSVGRRFSASSTSWRAVHDAGHDHVGEEQVDGGDGIDDLQGFGGIGRLERGVAEAFDLGHDVSAHQRIVFDDEDDLVCRPRCWRKSAASAAVWFSPVARGRYILTEVPWPSSL